MDSVYLVLEQKEENYTVVCIVKDEETAKKCCDIHNDCDREFGDDTWFYQKCTVGDMPIDIETGICIKHRFELLPNGTVLKFLYGNGRYSRKRENIVKFSCEDYSWYCEIYGDEGMGEDDAVELAKRITDKKKEDMMRSICCHIQKEINCSEDKAAEIAKIVVAEITKPQEEK